MQLQQPSVALVEPLSTFFPRWCSYSISYSRRLGCLRPRECGTDSFTKFIMRENASGSGRAVITGEQITINFPNARNQQNVLATFVKLNARSAYHRCQDCQHFKECRVVAEDYSAAADEGTRNRSAVPTCNVTPEEAATHNELLKKLINAAPEDQRQDLIDHIMGESFVDIARRRNIKPDALRQRFLRFRQRVAPLFGRKFRNGRKQ